MNNETPTPTGGQVEAVQLGECNVRQREDLLAENAALREEKEKFFWELGQIKMTIDGMGKIEGAGWSDSHKAVVDLLERFDVMVRTNAEHMNNAERLSEISKSQHAELARLRIDIGDIIASANDMRALIGDCLNLMGEECAGRLEDAIKHNIAELARLREEKQERENQLSIQIGVNEKMRDRIDTLRETNAGLVKQAGDLLIILEAHEVDTLDCDRRGEKYCDCLSNHIRRLKAALDAAKGGEA